MNNFFKLMHKVADTDERPMTSIKELTIAIAKSGGYRREPYTYKNGKTVIRTVYGNRIKDDEGNVTKVSGTWDSSLVAKWFCYYEQLFKSKLFKHPEFSEYYTFILHRTFDIVFNSLQLDKITHNGVVTRLVNMSLSNRIGEVICMIGSDERIKNAMSKEKDPKVKRVCMKKAINHSAIPLSALESDESNFNIVDDKTKYCDIETDANILDLKNIVKNNKYGYLVLESLLYSDKKVNTSKLSDFINIPKEEQTSEVLADIKDSFIKITTYMYNNINDENLKDRLSKKFNYLTGARKNIYKFEQEMCM